MTLGKNIGDFIHWILCVSVWFWQPCRGSHSSVEVMMLKLISHSPRQMLVGYSTKEALFPGHC